MGPAALHATPNDSLPRRRAQVLAYYGYVNFSWRHVGASLGRSLDVNNDGCVPRLSHSELPHNDGAASPKRSNSTEACCPSSAANCRLPSTCRHVDLRDVGAACHRFSTWALSWGLPSLVGFALGYYVGWRWL